MLGLILGVGFGLIFYGSQIGDLVQFLVLAGVGVFLGAYSLFVFWGVMTGRWGEEEEA